MHIIRKYDYIYIFYIFCNIIIHDVLDGVDIAAQTRIQRDFVHTSGWVSLILIGPVLMQMFFLFVFLAPRGVLGVVLVFMFILFAFLSFGESQLFKPFKPWGIGR
jgi:hypothetical protein